MDSQISANRPRRKRPLLSKDDADEPSNRGNDIFVKGPLAESPRHFLRRSTGVPDPLQIHAELLSGFDETEDSPSKLKSPRFFPSVLRESVRPKWKKAVLLGLMLRCLWYLGKLHTRVLTSLGQNLNTGTPFLRIKPSGRSEPWLDDPYNTTSSRQRRDRIKPNLHVKERSIVNGNIISLPTITMDLDFIEYNWRELCHGAGLDKKSRVVLTNPFALDSPASAFAMLIHHQCHVTDIQLIDPMMPEDPSSRAKLIRQYLVPLHKSIRTLRPLEISTVGKVKNWFVHQHYDTNITHPAPTHVIHFPFISSATEDKLDSLLSEPNFRLLSYRTATLQMEEFLARILLPSSTASYLQVLFPSSVDKHNPQAFSLSQQLSSILYRYTSSKHNNIARNQLLLLPTFGPGVSVTTDEPSSTSLYVEDVLAALLTALRPTPQPVQYSLPRSMEVSPKSIPKLSWIRKRSNKVQVNNTRLFQSLAWLYDENNNQQKHVNMETTIAEQLDAASSRNDYLFGLPKPSFPCLSSCGSAYFPSRCQPSLWDDIAPASRQATSNCSHVAYQVDLDQQLESLPEIPVRAPQLCRLAFVSVSAPVVSTAIQLAMQNGNEIANDTNLSWNDAVRVMNGKLEYSGWTLIWLSPPDIQLSTRDNAIPIIDPKGLFADHVEKVMYVGSPTLAATSDNALHQIMKSTDRRSSPGDKVKETRRGVSGFRWIYTEPYKARKTVFFVGGAGPMYMPKNASDFADMVSASVTLPDHQVSFYERVVEMSRYEDEYSMKAIVIQFEWVALSVFIHDLESKEAQAFRCEWFDEYLAWGDNRNAEELSLAFLLGLKRMEGTLGPEKEKSWFPFTDANQNPLVTSKDEEVFLRILSQ